MTDDTRQFSSQNKPEREGTSTEGFESMSPVELADALEQALASMTGESYDATLIDAYLTALDQKVPMPEAPDADASLRDFRAKLASVSLDRKAEAAPAAPAKKRPFRRFLLTIAATVALFFVLMVGAQASGLDVFGNLARWTDDIFRFVSSAPVSEEQAVFRQALAENGLPTELAPAWFPEGFQAGEPEVWSDESGQAVQLDFFHKDGRFFSVSVQHYTDKNGIEKFPFEKDDTPVEEFHQSGRKFYIMANLDTRSATWTDGSLVETIMGQLSDEEIKMIIGSIGG